MTDQGWHRFFMRAMVWNMRWMSRHAGFIARPIVRLYGENEIIACGLRDADGSVAIIYTPNTGHRDHAVLMREGRQWVKATFNPTSSFSGTVVLRFSVPGARNGMRYKMVGTTANGRRLSSPTTTVKPQTISDPTLLEIESFTTNRNVSFSWRRAETYDPMIYFLVVEDDRGATNAAIYTRETFWNYPRTESASYFVGPAHPPPLVPGERYRAKLTLVDYDGWVSHMAVKTFAISSESSSFRVVR